MISALLANTMFRGCLSARIFDNFIPGTVRLLLCVCLHSHPSHIYTRRRLLQLFKLSMYTRINWLLTFPFGVLKGGDCCCICNVVCCSIPYEHCGDGTSLNCAGSWATDYCFPIKCDTQCFLNSLFPTFLSNETHLWSMQRVWMLSQQWLPAYYSLNVCCII